MVNEIPNVGELELRVLEFFWSQQPATERAAWEALDAQKPVGRTTVLKTIQRLEAKKLLKRTGSRKSPIQYKTSMQRCRVLPALVDRFVTNVLGGAAGPLVAYLAESAELSKRDLEQLEKIADKIDSHTD